jgi:hypothetical protein
MGAGPGAVSIVFERDGLVLDSWFDPPALVSASRAQVSWTPPVGAGYSGALYRTMTGGGELVEILAFDGTTTAALPAAITLPAVPLTAQAIAVRSIWDNADFSFAGDFAKQDASSSSATTVVP